MKRLGQNPLPILASLFVMGFAIAMWVDPPLYKTFLVSDPEFNSHPQKTDTIEVGALLSTEFLLWLFNSCLVGVFGWTLLSAVWPRPLTRNIFAPVAGFWLGYLGVTGLVRLQSLAFSGTWLYVAVVVTMAALRHAQRPGWPKRFGSVGVLGLGLALLVPILLLQIYQGEFRWNGHGPLQYAFYTEEWFKGRIPILKQHYDEVLYHAFLTQPFGLKANPILPWWLTLGLNKISLLAFFILAFAEMGVGTLAAVCGGLFLFFGTSSLLPWKYYSLFDSNNPLGFTVHSGRLLGPGIALLFLVWLQHNFSPRRWAQVLLAVGIVMTPFSNFLWLLPLWLGWFFSKRELPLKIPLSGLAAIPAFYLMPMRLTAWLNFFAIGALVKKAWKQWSLKKPVAEVKVALKSWPYPVFGFALLGSALFLGNLFCGQPLGRLFAWGLGLEQIGLQSQGFHIVPLDRLFADHREMEDSYNIYNRSSLHVIAVYGLYFWLMALALVRSQVHSLERRWLSILNLLLMMTFFLVDFVGVSTRSWFLTRFLEVPVYLSVFFSALVLLKSPALKKWACTLMMIYSIGPFLGTGRVLQILANFEAFYLRIH